MKLLLSTALLLPLIILNIIPSNACDTKMVCYFGSWSVYRPGAGKFDVEDIDPFLCTHVIFGFAALSEVDYSITAYDPWNELDASEPGGHYGAYRRFVNLRNKNPSLKVLLAIGGWNEGSEKYSKMAASPILRANFVQSVVAFIKKYGFDGLDFDWEYPGTRGGDPAIDKANFITLIRQLKTAFLPYGYILTSAVSPGQINIDIAYDIPALSNILDQIHIMGYDYHGAWENFTGLNSPLYPNEKYDIGNETTLNVEWTVNYWISKGADLSKLILGMPLYGRGFLLDDPTQNGLRAPASNPIPGGPYSRLNGTWGYNEICESFMTMPDWIKVRDPCYQSPYAYRSNMWIGYDDPPSLILKAQFAKAMNLGGALVWSIDMDDFSGVCTGKRFGLTNTIKTAMQMASSSLPSKCAPPTTTTTTTTTTRPTTTTTTTTTKPTTTSTTTTTTTTTTRTTTPTTTTTTTTPTTTTMRTTTTARITTPKPAGTQGQRPICDGYPPSIPICVDNPRDAICRDAKDSLLPYPNNCYRFLQCVKDNPVFGEWIVYTHNCPSNLVFNTTDNVCAFQSFNPPIYPYC